MIIFYLMVIELKRLFSSKQRDNEKTNIKYQKRGLNTAEIGINYRSYFSKKFSEAYEISPKEYRQESKVGKVTLEP